MKRVIDVSLRQFVEKIMHGTISYEKALKERGDSVVRGMCQFEDFNEWVNEHYNPSIIKLLRIAGSDIVMRLALASPFGYLSLVLATKKSFNELLSIRPYVFFEICRALFSDVLMEEIIKDTLRKDNRYFQTTMFKGDQFKLLRDGGFQPPLIKLLKSLSNYDYWKEESELPSLSNYNIVLEGWTRPDILRKCRNNPEIRLCVHDMFKMVYPLGLPQQEYCFTQDVLLMTHVYRLVTVSDMLQKSITHDTSFSKEYERVLFEELLGSSILCEGTKPYTPQNMDFYFTNAMFSLHSKLVTLNAFNEKIRAKYLNRQNVVNDANIMPANQTTLFNRLPNMYFDNTPHIDAFHDLRRRYTPIFDHLLTLERLVQFTKKVLFVFIEKLEELHQQISSVHNRHYLYDIGIKLPSVDITELLLIKNYCGSWLKEMEEDLKKYPYEQLFRDSDLVVRLSQSIFSNKCDISESKALVVYIPNNLGNTRNEIPIPGCGNKWLSRLSKRLQYYFLSNESTFYNELRREQGLDNLGQCFNCGLGKDIQLFHDPLSKQTFCGTICRKETFEKHALYL
jgi:hypothetical protein